jgi:glutaredoxin-like protein NrdH
MIIVYTKPQCVQCEQTKKLLTKNGLEFDTVDITQDTEAYDKVVAMGFLAAPVVVTKDDSWAGFQPEKINGLVSND